MDISSTSLSNLLLKVSSAIITSCGKEFHNNSNITWHFGQPPNIDGKCSCKSTYILVGAEVVLQFCL